MRFCKKVNILKNVFEGAHLLSLSGSCDVLVAGGGIAGIAAALAAARQGSRVILLEKQYILGGLATAGLVTVYLPLCNGQGKQISYGIAEELLRLSVKYGAEKDYPNFWLDGPDCEGRKCQRFLVQYNPHIFAILTEQLLYEANVKILYGTSVCSVKRKGNRISHIIVENKSGRSAIALRSVVDATGDADVCSLAGERTAVFKQRNPVSAWYYYMSAGSLNLNILGECDTPEEYKKEQVKPLSSRRFEGLDAWELSEMTLLSHNITLEDLIARRKTQPDTIPVTIPSIPQIRMTRRIIGTVTIDDTAVNERNNDSIGCAADWRKKGVAYELPFGCLFGNKVKNLITAGRCISSTDSMWDITRVIPVCAVTGEAAGTAAAQGIDFEKLSVLKLQNELRSKGVRIHLSEI